jgi:AcrR family transcriptional regulator
MAKSETESKSDALICWAAQGDLGYTGPMTGARENARVALTAEIERLARVQVERDGAASLSLRAIARDLNMVSSAIYRYFASRDELLTRLIIHSYQRLGDTVEVADAAVRKRTDFAARWKAITRSMRQWAIVNPSEYALLFGTPVPGYAAPSDTIAPATRYTMVLIKLIVDMEADGYVSGAKVPGALRKDYVGLRRQLNVASAESDPMLMNGMIAWANVLGVISLELFGHLHNVVDTPGALFEAVVEQHWLRLSAEHR